MSTINRMLFVSQLSPLLVSLGYHMAVWYFKRYPYNSNNFSKELYASKRTIIKVSQVNATACSYRYFSIHRRDKNLKGEYSWYYEKYKLGKPPKSKNGAHKERYIIWRYGHYPYYWE